MFQVLTASARPGGIRVCNSVLQAIQGACAQGMLNEAEGLCAVRGVTAVNQDSFVGPHQQHIVGGQPAALKKAHVRRKQRVQKNLSQKLMG